MIQKAAWFTFFAFLAFSCLDDPDCYNLNNNVIGIAFRKMADNRADTVRLVRVEVNGADSIFYEFTIASGITIPVNYQTDQSLITLFRETDAGIVEDMLLVGYDSKIQFVSADCGEKFVLGNLHIQEHTFDSIQVVNNIPTATPSTNIAIYRCPVTNYMKVGFRQLYADEDTIGDPLDVVVETISSDHSPTPHYVQDTASSFRLPLNQDATATAFAFEFAEGSRNLSVSYNRYEEALFIPCGIQPLFGSLSVDETDLGFYKLVNDTIMDPSVTNVLFYRCPETHLVKLDFKASDDDNAPNASVTVQSVMTDFSAEPFYVNATVETMTLPLNTEADQTTYTFTFEDNSVRQMTLTYTRSEAVYHEVCVQTEVTNLAVGSADFTTAPEVVAASTEFPAVTNVEIVND